MEKEELDKTATLDRMEIVKNKGVFNAEEECSNEKEISMPRFSITDVEGRESCDAGYINVKLIEYLSPPSNMDFIDTSTIVVYNTRGATPVCEAFYKGNTYFLDWDDDKFSQWQCNKLTSNLSKCSAILKLKKYKRRTEVLEIGWHVCKSASQKISPLVFPDTKVKDRSAKNYKSSKTNAQQLSELVYTEKSLEKVATLIHDGKSNLENFYNKIEILHVSGKVYDLDFNDASAVLCYENKSEMAYYKGRTYQKYHSGMSDNSDAQYRCNRSPECPAELRLTETASRAAYVLRFEHHTCSGITLLSEQSNVEEESSVQKCSVLELYNKIGVKSKHSSNPLLYCHGYLYTYIEDTYTFVEETNNLEYVGQLHKFKCLSSVNCEAQLLFRSVMSSKKVFKIEEHTCKDKRSADCKRKSFEIIDKGIRNPDNGDIIDLTVDEGEVENNSSSATDNIQQNDNKTEEVGARQQKVLNNLIEINQDYTNLQIGFTENYDDLDYTFHIKAENSDIVDSDEEDCLNIYESPESTHQEDAAKEHLTSLNTSQAAEIVSTKRRNNEIMAKGQDEDVEVHRPTAFINCSLDNYKTEQQFSGEKPKKSKTYILDPTTKKRIFARIDFQPVEIINLGYIIDGMPKVDPDDPTTVFRYFASNRRVLHYMGYDFYKTRSQTSYRCSMSNICSAGLKLSKDKQVALFGKHTCRRYLNDLTADPSGNQCSDEQHNTSENYSKENMASLSVTKTTTQLNDKSPIEIKEEEEEAIGVKKESAETPDIINIIDKDSVSITEEFPDGDVSIQKLVETTLDAEFQSDAVDNDPRNSYKPRKGALNVPKGDASGLLNFITIDRISSDLHTSVEITREEDIDIKIERPELPDGINVIDETCCSLKEEFLDPDSSIENFVDTQTDSVTADASDSSDLVLHYCEKRSKVVAYKGYEYLKEDSGKFAWCRKSKICSGMIRILPDYKGEIIGQHTCNENTTPKTYENDQNDFTNDNDESVRVHIKTISDIPEAIKPVPYKEQSRYEVVSSGRYSSGIIFKGYTHTKDWEDGNTVTYLCVHKKLFECPGMVQMQQYKLVRYRDHLCNRTETPALPDATDGKHSTVFVYLNRLTSEPEARYKRFTYRRTSRTNHVSTWQCAAKAKWNCTAGIEIYTFTSTLLETGRHVCTREHLQTAPDPANRDNVSSKLSSCKKTSPKNFVLPGFANKSIIPVYNDQQELNVIYQGYIYRGKGKHRTCIRLQSQGCTGSLQIRNGNVMNVSTHDCFENKTCRSAGSLQNSYPNYTEFLSNVLTTTDTTRDAVNSEDEKSPDLDLFQGGFRGEFAMYEGYVYKKMFTVKTKGVFRWNCARYISHKCHGVLTTRNYKVLATSQHVCKNEDNCMKGPFEYYGNKINPSTINLDGTDSNAFAASTVNKTDQKLTNKKANNKRKTKYKTGDTEPTGEILPSKRIRKSRNARISAKKESNCAEEDIAAQIPAAPIDQFEENSNGDTGAIKAKSDNNKERVRRCRNAKKNIQYDEDSEHSELIFDKPGKETSEEFGDHKKNVEVNLQYNKDTKQLEFAPENEDSKSSIILMNEENQMESIDKNFQDDNATQSLELISEREDFNSAISTVKEENLDSGSGDDDVPFVLSRGPNGEYFVHVGNRSDTNELNEL